MSGDRWMISHRERNLLGDSMIVRHWGTVEIFGQDDTRVVVKDREHKVIFCMPIEDALRIAKMSPGDQMSMFGFALYCASNGDAWRV